MNFGVCERGVRESPGKNTPILFNYAVIVQIMAPILYYAPQSPPCQLVMLIAKYLNTELDMRLLNPREGGITPEFLKVNPTHQIPALDDNGFYLSESRAIAIYLLEKYGNADTLIPKDIKLRALVNHRLYFDAGVLWQRGVAIVRPILFGNYLPADDKFESLEEGLGFLDAFLKGRKWLVGDGITLADYSVLTTVSFADTIPLIDLKRYSNVSAWYELAKKSVKGYDEIVAPIVISRRKQIMEKYLELKSKQNS